MIEKFPEEISSKIESVQKRQKVMLEISVFSRKTIETFIIYIHWWAPIVSPKSAHTSMAKTKNFPLYSILSFFFLYYQSETTYSF